jgi:CDP-diacylglycerol---glycerol-3-phosphate 3-phosphatidyltransferase
MRFLPSNLREQVTRLLVPVLDLFVHAGLSPNALTTLGFLVTVSAGVAFFYGSLQLGGFLVLAGGFLDVVDG